MIDLDDELAREYLAESREHLATINIGLLTLEKGAAEIDAGLLNRLFRAAHSVSGGAGFFGLWKIRDLAREMEDLLALFGAHKMTPTPHGIRVLLRAADKLGELIESPGASNRADIAFLAGALARLSAEHAAAAGKCAVCAANQARLNGRRPRALLAEDDLVSRRLLQIFLSRHGACDVAVNGKEAVDAFRAVLERGERYDLICMDIMMPEMDGRDAVRQIRALEEAHGIFSTEGAKIVMTTAVVDIREVIRCFKELCDAYLLKPIDLTKLAGLMKSYQLVP